MPCASWLRGSIDCAGPELGVLVITHYQRILNYVQPDFVHIMLDGQIVESGEAQLALKLEENGYDWVRAKYGEPESMAGEAT